MSKHWIHRIIRRDRKRQATLRTRLRLQRQLRLQSMEARQLLAGDAMSPEPAEMPGLVSLMEHSAANSIGHDLSGDSGQEAHPDNPAMAGEHSAALSLVDMNQVTNTVVESGDWSDPTIWSNNELPGDMARVHIPEGITVTVDGLVGETLYTVRVDGTLRFDATINTELKVDTIVSSPNGRLEMGTPESPINADVTSRILIADTGAIDRSWDPRALSRGLVLHGTTVINGATKNSWSTLEVAPIAGDQTITLAEQPDGWRVGDNLVIAGTKSDATGDEVRTIAGIDGNVVTLNEALDEDHIPPEADLQVHVANTTRNAIVESQNDEVNRRGHVMFMHNRDVQVAHTGFYQLGRTNKLEENDDPILDEDGNLVPGTGTNPRGRYSVHFHINGTQKDSPASSLVGSAVVGSPGWGYVNHSSYVDMIDNVSYDVDGAAFNTEVGDEVGSFVNNLSIRTHGTGGLPNEDAGAQDFGRSGDGFWFHGSGIQAEGNVASGATGSGIIFYGETLILGERDDEFEPLPGTAVPEYRVENLPDPSLVAGRTTIPTLMVPFHNVRNNTAYGSNKGFEIYKHRIGGLTQQQIAELGIDSGYNANNPLNLPDGVIDGVTVWNSRNGVKLSYTADVQFKNVRVVNDVDQVGEAGFDATNVYNRGNHTYENLTIRGFNTGIFPSRGETVVIDAGRFANGVDIAIPEVRRTHRRLEIRGDVQFETLPDGASPDLASDRQNIVMQADLRDLVDGNVTWFLLSDRAILNFGDFDGDQIYYDAQSADRVLFPQQPDQVVPDDPGFGIPPMFIGLSNAELQEQFMTSFGGSLPPDGAVDAPGDGIIGLIGDATGSPELPPAPLDNDVAVVPGVPGFEQPDDDVVEDDNDDDLPNDEDNVDEGVGDEPEESDCDHDEDPDLDEEDHESDPDEEDVTLDEEPLDQADEEPEQDDELLDEEDEEEPCHEEDGDEFDEDLVEEDEPADEEDGELDGDLDEEPDDESEEADDESNEEDFGEGDEEEPLDDEFDEPIEDEESDDGAEGDDEADGDEEESDDEDFEDESSPFQNQDEPTDVNNDGNTSPSDALMVINYLSTHESGLIREIAQVLGRYIDVNGDGSASAMDVLRIINFLSRFIDVDAEAESSDFVRSTHDQAFDSDNTDHHVDDDLLSTFAGS